MSKKTHFSILKTHIFSLPLHPISNTRKHMLDLSQIFPINYPDVPTHEDIEFMFKEILNHSDSVNQVVREIEKETCPYYKEALIHCLAAKLDYWYENQKSIAGIDHGDCWIPYWEQPQDKIRQLVNRYQAEQKQFTYNPLQTSPLVAADCPDLSAIPLSQPSTPTVTCYASAGDPADSSGSSQDVDCELKLSDKVVDVVVKKLPTGNQSTETSLQSLVQSLRKVMTEVTALRNANTYQNITINMPVYVVQSGNVGTFVGDVGTFVGQAENINLK